MRFQDLTKGKYYFRKVKAPGGGGRTTEEVVYKMLVVDKDQDQTRILASVVPDTGKPTAPAWYDKEQFQRWKTEK